MHTVAIVNLKGGSCKTTSAVSLAASLAEQGRCLLYDLDPQASATSWCAETLTSEQERGRDCLSALTGATPLERLASPTTIPGVDLIASSPWLRRAEQEITRPVHRENILKERLTALPDHWQTCLIDCGPSLDFLTLSALVAADQVLIPVETRAMALEGLVRLLNFVDEVQASQPNPTSTQASATSSPLILLCRVDQRTRLSRDVVAHLRSQYGSRVLQAEIPETIRLAEAPSHRQAIRFTAPESPATHAYHAAAKELSARLEISSSEQDTRRRTKHPAETKHTQTQPA